MGKEKQALKPDIIVKNYWRNKEQFADFFNAVLFDGKQVIKPKELEDLDTEESSVLEHKEYAESVERYGQNSKKVYRIWRGICYTGNGRTGAYSLCDAHAGNGV